MMTRDTEAALLRFCTQQYREFSVAAWDDFPHPDRGELKVAAAFLARIASFGHTAQLHQVVKNFDGDLEVDFSQLVMETEFDCGRFSNMLRRAIEHA
jgi:hypothetical protein